MRCNIDGVIIRELNTYNDARGWLIELFRKDEVPEESFPIMAYLSLTHSGGTRGPHEHKAQTDYFCFVGPSTFRLYLWDNRPGSPTYGESFRIEVGAELKVSVIIPPGVVHAYKNIGGIDGIVYNAPNRLYAGWGKNEPIDEIRYEDDRQSKFRVDS
jgi:dTDP-4-dehydrorhamnose 3,5-epimerase